MKAEEFSQYLKSLRKEKKLTMRQLDVYSGVSHSYISQMERGDRGIPSPDILKKLAKPLGVSYEELMEKAGYITKEEMFKTAINEGYLDEYKNSELFNEDERATLKILFEDPEHVLNVISEEGKNKFFNELFSNEGSNDDFWNNIIQVALRKKGLDHERVKDIVNELENLSEKEVDDVIDFIRYKKSKTTEK